MKRKSIAMMLIVAITGSSIPFISAHAMEKQNVEYNNSIPVFQSSADKFMLTSLEIGAKLQEERNNLEKEKATKEAEVKHIKEENSRKNNVTFNPDDVTQITGLTANELYEVLSGFKKGALANYAWTIHDCEKQYHINAFFLAGLIAQESGWASSYRAINQNNLTGHAVYNNQAQGTYFDSQDDCIYSTAEMLHDNYLTPHGKNYNGKSIWNVNSNYCFYLDGSAPDYTWSDNISSIATKFNNYYHNHIKKLDKVPTVSIDIDKQLEQKRDELMKPNLY